MNDKTNTRDLLDQHDIPRAAIAELANVHPPEVSLYLRNPRRVSEDRRRRIESAVADVVLMLDGLESGLPAVFVLRPDWRDVESLRALIRYTKDEAYRAEIDSGVANLALKNLGATAPGTSAA